MVEFSNQKDEERSKKFESLLKKKEDVLKEIGEEKEKGMEELRGRELALEALRRGKEEAEKKIKALTEKEKEKSKELEEEKKKLKEEADALAKKIESEAEELARLRKPLSLTQEGLEEVVVQAAQGLPEQRAQDQPQALYQSPALPQEGSLYQRLAELRSGIYGIASHRVTGTQEVSGVDRSQIGSLYSQLQDIVQGLASHVVQGRRLEEADASQVTQALNATMQAVENLGEAYSGRFENLLNRARGYLSKQEEIYKTPGT